MGSDSEERLILRLFENAPTWRAYAELYPSVFARVERIAAGSAEVRRMLRFLAAKTTVEADSLSARFGLTPAEADLARHLMGGGSLATYAARRQISRNTARNQLQMVFEKTGVNRQSALVRLLFETAAELAASGTPSAK